MITNLEAHSKLKQVPFYTSTVQWRKTSFGSRSAEGEVAVARLLTVTRTCRMQNRQPLDYLAEAVAAHRKPLPAPSLLQTTQTT
jgi:transposase